MVEDDDDDDDEDDDDDDKDEDDAEGNNAIRIVFFRTEVNITCALKFSAYV